MFVFAAFAFSVPAKKPLPSAPAVPRLTLGRFRFYLSKVFHSTVIVWVASSIVAKANIYLGFSLLSTGRASTQRGRRAAAAGGGKAHCATNWICGSQIKCCRKKWAVAVEWHYQKIDRRSRYKHPITFHRPALRHTAMKISRTLHSSTPTKRNTRHLNNNRIIATEVINLIYMRIREP